jgi:hypothetical protein
LLDWSGTRRRGQVRRPAADRGVAGDVVGAGGIAGAAAKIALAAVTLDPAARVVVPPSNSTVPAPVKLPLSVAPPIRSTVPASTFRVPLLLNAGSIVVVLVPEAAVLSNSPALSKTPVPKY